MIVVKIIGGLGNQMFQFAIAHALATKHQSNFFLDISGFEAYPLRRFELDEVFGIKNTMPASLRQHLPCPRKSLLQRVWRRLIRRVSIPAYPEAGFAYDSCVDRLAPPVYLEGYWQSEKYFARVQHSLRDCFSFKRSLSYSNQQYAKAIQSCESVSLHIRRGDYATDAKTNSVHGLLALSYYQRAVSFIQASQPEAHFFIFSDDIAWAKENLTFIENIKFIENKDDAPDWQEMCLMSYCKHNIIANSSFSWWGAWLNNYSDKKVVAPAKWFNDSSIDTSDLIPDGWFRL